MAAPLFDDFKNMLRHLKVYLLGKGILTLGVFAAVGISSAFNFSVLLPAMVIGIGGTVLTAADRLYKQSLYQDDMVELYRDNIAEQLGKQPEEITRADLREAAKSNEVIAQALRRRRQKTILDISTAALSGVVSIALIVGLGLDTQSLRTMAEGSLWGALKPLAHLIGLGTVSGATSLLLHEGLGSAIGYGTGISQAAAHDLIFGLNRKVGRGLPVSREDVYGVVVAANVALDQRIASTYGRHYPQMSQAQQAQVLHDFDLNGVTDKLAVAISSKQIRAGALAYAANDPRLAAPVENGRQ